MKPHALWLAGLALLTAAWPAIAQPRAALDARTAGTIECTALAAIDFSRDKEAPATITSAKLLRASATNGEVCAVTGYVQPQVQFEVRLPTKSWNGRYSRSVAAAFAAS